MAPPAIRAVMVWSSPNAGIFSAFGDEDRHVRTVNVDRSFGGLNGWTRRRSYEHRGQRTSTQQPANRGAPLCVLQDMHGS